MNTLVTIGGHVQADAVFSNPSAGVGSDVGVEYIYAIRTTEDGAKGRLKRLPMSAKYTF